MLKIITVVGARPQFVKAATVSRAIESHNNSESPVKVVEKIIHTGQHYDANMSDVFFDEMKIPQPSYSLGVGGSSHGEMTGQQLIKIEQILIEEKPGAVLVYGDTNSTLAGALAAAKLHIPVVHVEAGLRSFNMRMPEEINRILTDNISTLLLCPSELAINNLSNEGFLEKKNCIIHNVGDVMYDAVKYYEEFSKKPKEVDSENFVLLTIHRAENTDNLTKLATIADAINLLAEEVDIICPIHPRTRKILSDNDIKINAVLIDPVGYFEMLWLIKNCEYVMTDSGGLQKEAYFLKKGCVTLRDQTEWKELIEAKVNILTEISVDSIVQSAEYIKKLDLGNATSGDFYGVGNAAPEIVRYVIREFAL